MNETRGSRKDVFGAVWLAAALVLFGTAKAAQDPLTVAKLDPPGWFTDLQQRQVLLLVSGRGLQGASISCDSPQVKAAPVQASACGRYLFAEVTIAPSAPPGDHVLRDARDGVVQEARFNLRPSCLAEHPPTGSGPDDVVYMPARPQMSLEPSPLAPRKWKSRTIPSLTHISE